MSSWWELSPAAWSAVRLSLVVALLSTILNLGPGILLGWLLARRRFPGHTLFEAFVYAPLVLPPVLVGYALLILFGRRGWLGEPLNEWFGIEIAFTLWGAALAAAIIGLPLLVRSVRLSIELIDRRYEQAASTLGASPVRVFRTITLPLAFPGILSGAVLCFARALGEFGATITFAGSIEGRTRTIPLALFNELQTPHGEAEAAKLAVIALLLSLAALMMSEWLARRTRARMGMSSA